MSDQADNIVKRYGDVMVERSASRIAYDIKAIIDQEEQLANPEQVGSALIPVIPQEKFRVVQLLRMNRARPTTPRWNTGKLVESIGSMMGGVGLATVDMGGFDESIALGQQEGNQGYSQFGWTSPPIPPRPFFGISDRALKDVEAIVADEGGKLVAELDTVKLEDVYMTI